MRRNSIPILCVAVTDNHIYVGVITLYLYDSSLSSDPKKDVCMLRVMHMYICLH